MAYILARGFIPRVGHNQINGLKCRRYVTFYIKCTQCLFMKSFEL